MNTPGISDLGSPSPLLLTDRPEQFLSKHDDVALLHAMARRLAAATSLDEVLKEAVEFVTSVAKCDSCFVYVLEGEELVLRASRNPHPEVVDRLKMKLGQGITGWVAKHREPVAIARNAYRDPRFRVFNELPEDRYESILSVPVVTAGRLVGVINLQTRAEHRHAEREICLVSTIGFLIGTEIERARLEGENLSLLGKLEVRTFVERAKGILQRDLNISEDAAYRVMQRESQERRKSMKEIAEAVILSDSLRSSLSSPKTALSKD